LLDRAAIATPHIAGYSLEGKIRATAMAAGAVDNVLDPEMPIELDMSHIVRDSSGQWINIPQGTPSHISLKKISGSYDIMADTMTLKTMPEEFENLRNNYRLRNEVI
ncbi:MAG: erythronate-4-phosphate dehydrogenase, partial [Muribaculaceae bacterium]|nr:erythronate-4-phosphate dehydrogenase [Muribaculaceae bacterium]